jgi:excisionase family DNA binding protein
MSEALLDIAQVAERLNVKVATIRKWRERPNEADRGPRAVKLGRHLRWRPSDVDEFVKSRLEGQTNVTPIISRRAS